MKSDDAKKGIERAPHRALFKAIGYTDEEISGR
jgi:dihydroxy-acid dehydratase